MSTAQCTHACVAIYWGNNNLLAITSTASISADRGGALKNHHHPRWDFDWPYLVDFLLLPTLAREASLCS